MKGDISKLVVMALKDIDNLMMILTIPVEAYIRLAPRWIGEIMAKAL
jgi:hypothetical protein